jgi:hypothetical protein
MEKRGDKMRKKKKKGKGGEGNGREGKGDTKQFNPLPACGV